MRAALAGLAILALGWVSGIAGADTAPRRPTDPATGLVLDPRTPVVAANCTVCHSAALVTQMRATRDTWESLIRWMQATQNLWTFPPDTEATLLDYLSEYYGPATRAGRRKPLPASLRPPAAETLGGGSSRRPATATHPGQK